ncbi:hypothetical protein [Rhodobacter calidifons]|uniref:Uncharacterized protein n=1 Tax=Rhodobacter calidifons TaxID=2715277 RepID=A0ABX0G9B3_9RHOB|nr:hypothetical protein [Rhodobacter calidifons]NHB77463.1 hypothetical protein [Rhodobacter calidifons]
MEMLLGLAITLCLPAYLVAQVLALMHWPLRVSLVPLIVMGAAFAAFLSGLARGSNLAPIFMVLAAPPCLAWLGLMRLMRS